MNEVIKFPTANTRVPSKPLTNIEITQSIAQTVYGAMQMLTLRLPDAKNREELRLLHNAIEALRLIGYAELAELHRFDADSLWDGERNA